MDLGKRSVGTILALGVGAFIVGTVSIALIVGTITGGDERPVACGSVPRPALASTELVYLPREGAEEVTADSIAETVERLCGRLQGFGVSDGYVAALSEDRIGVAFPEDVTSTDRAITQVGTTAQLHFYDRDEWKAAARSTTRQESQQLIFSGAFPTAYDAV